MSHHYASKKSSPNLKIPRFHSLSSESFIVLLIHFELDFMSGVWCEWKVFFAQVYISKIYYQA